jgi:hypothetical protein
MQNGDAMQKSKKGMWCQWHRMHDSCGVIDTHAYVHVVSLTLHKRCMLGQ